MDSASAVSWADWKAAGGHILVIEDDDAIRTVVQRALATTGFTVKAAPGGREGVSLFAKDSGKYQLVIMDLKMPGMEAPEIVAKLRAVNPSVRILLMSGYNRQKAMQETISLSLNAFLPKPFSLNELIAKVRSIVES